MAEALVSPVDGNARQGMKMAGMRAVQDAMARGYGGNIARLTRQTHLAHAYRAGIAVGVGHVARCMAEPVAEDRCGLGDLAQRNLVRKPAQIEMAHRMRADGDERIGGDPAATWRQEIEEANSSP